MRSLRSQFPILKIKINRKPLVYFDNAATTQKPAQVIAAEKQFYETINSNVHRSINPLGEQATQAYESARGEIAKFVNAKSPREIVFTRNTTESLNLLSRVLGKWILKKGDRVVLSVAEHHSNIVPWLQLKKEKGITISFIPLNDAHDNYNLSQARNYIFQKDVKIVSLCHASNALGVTFPIEPLLRLAKSKKRVTIVDAAQSVAHFPTDVQKLGCDFLAFSGHKIFGPTGIGVLWGRENLLTSMPEFLGGGEMIREVFFDHFTTNDVPWKFEAGTPNIAGAITLGAAVSFINKIGFAKIQKIERELTQYLHHRLSQLSFITLHGFSHIQNHLPIAAFNMKNLHAHDLVDLLGDKGIMLRSGHHCTMPLHRILGVPATARASLSFYNTKQEIDIFVKALREIYNRFH